MTPGRQKATAHYHVTCLAMSLSEAGLVHVVYGTWLILCAIAATGGECDVRACYTAMAIAHCLCLDVQDLVHKSAMVHYLRRCQV